MKILLRNNAIPFILLGLIIIAHLFTLYRTVFWPAMEFRTFPYLTAQGLLPYKEIFDQHFPGVFFFPINLYTLGLATPYGLRLLQFFLIFVSQLFIYIICRKLTKSPFIPLLANTVYIFLQVPFEGYVFWIDSFIPPLLLLSYYLAIPNDKKIIWKLFLSGFFIALGMYFKQTIALVYICLAIYFFFQKQYKSLVLFSLGFFIPTVFLFFYFFHLGVWQDFTYWTFTFNTNVYNKLGFRDPTYKEILMYATILVPTFLSLFWNIYKDKKHILITIYLIPLITLIYGRYDFIHIQPLLPFTAISFAMFFNSQKNIKLQLFFPLYICLLILMTYLQIGKLGNSTTFIDASSRNILHELHTIKQHGKSVYILNNYFELYQLSGTVPSNKIFFINDPWYMQVLEKKLVKSFQESPPDYIIKYEQQGVNKNSIDVFLKQHYKKIKQIRYFEVLQRRI